MPTAGHYTVRLRSVVYYGGCEGFRTTRRRVRQQEGSQVKEKSGRDKSSKVAGRYKVWSLHARYYNSCLCLVALNGLERVREAPFTGGFRLEAG